MARLVRRGRSRRIVAETPDELTLLADTLRRGRELPLRGALFPISSRSLAVPEELGSASVEALRLEFELAARAHRDALERRGRFRST